MTCTDLLLCKAHAACYNNYEPKNCFLKYMYLHGIRMVLKSVHENMEGVAPEKAGRKFVVKEHKCAQGA